MTTRMGDAIALVARARRVGWPVTRMRDGAWKVRCPNGEFVQIHLTPSDVNAGATVLRELNNRGFDKAEKALDAREAKEKAAKLAFERAQAVKKTELLAKQSAAVAKAAGPYGASQVTIAEILAKHPAPIVWAAVLVTPEMATAMLERNTHNRHRSKRDVAERASELRTGRFAHMHQGIAFDSNGVLLDGQTRLEAIVETGITATLMVSAGWPPPNFAITDTGRRRTAAQVMSMGGAKYGSWLAGAIRLLYLHDKWKEEMLDHAKDRIANDLIVDFKVDEDVALAACRYGGRLMVEVGGGPGGPIAALYLIADAVGHEDDDFLDYVDTLITGTKDRDDPAHVVRRQLARSGNGNVRRRTPAEAMALILKGWNARVEGVRGVEYMKIVKGSSMPMPLAPGRRAA